MQIKFKGIFDIGFYTRRDISFIFLMIGLILEKNKSITFIIGTVVGKIHGFWVEGGSELE